MSSEGIRFLRGQILTVAAAAKPGAIPGGDTARDRYGSCDLRGFGPAFGRAVAFDGNGRQARMVSAVA